MFGRKIVKTEEYNKLLKQVETLNSTVLSLNNDIKGKDLKIADLNEEIADLNAQVKSLTDELGTYNPSDDGNEETVQPIKPIEGEPVNLIVDVAETPLDTEESKVNEDSTLSTKVRKTYTRKASTTKTARKVISKAKTTE